MTVRRRISLALLFMVILPLCFFLIAGFFARLWIIQGGRFDHFSRPGGLVGPLLVLLLYMALNGLLSWWVARGVVTPLAKLQTSAHRMGDGDLTVPVNVQGDREILALSGALETMRVKLRESLETQESHLQARKELLSHLSHDLRTPLSVLRGYAEGLRDGIPKTPEARDRYIQTILSRSTELELLIQQVLDFSILDAWEKKIPIEPHSFDSLDPIAKNLELQNPGIKILILQHPNPMDGPASESTQFLANSRCLYRILNNLTENSLRHSGAEPLNITWIIKREKNSGVLHVMDNGTGIVPEIVPRLFEPLFQGNVARSAGGSGLGLTIVSRLMEVQGGEARAFISDGGGLGIELEFQVFNPLEREI